MYPYQQKLNEILTNFLGTDVTVSSPYTEVRPVAKVAIVVFSSNSSLCGAFNSNVVKMLEHTLEEYSPLGKENILLYPVGRKVESWDTPRRAASSHWPTSRPTPKPTNWPNS